MTTALSTPSAPRGLRSLVSRQLEHYPSTGRRSTYLGIVVLSTIALYYEFYVNGSVSPQIAATYHMSLRYLVLVSLVGNGVGAFASLLAGLADRYGRANIVAFGLLATGVLVLAVEPNVGSKGAFLAIYTLVAVAEGMALVATPALIRDFSPQLGRASAMGFWTLGPVIGSLVVTEVSSHTLASHPNWRFQFHVAGIVGLVVWAIAFVGLRELAPALRDQLMVSERDRVLLEAKAKGIDVEAATKGGWRQMLRLDVIGPAFGISTFLLFYYVMVGFVVVYFATNFGYSTARANSLANWYWISNAIALVVTGWLSDRFRVRKPFMVAGAVLSIVGVAIFATRATHPQTGYYSFALLFVLISAAGGMTYCAWMASFTETVEAHNPAATATGLAVWGWTIRAVVAISFAAFIGVVTAASTLVDHGPTALALQQKYAAQLATAQKLTPATQGALAKDPTNQGTQAQAISEISGIPFVTVAQVVQASTQYAAQLATAQKLTSVTQLGLLSNPTDPAVQAQAVAEIAGVPVAQVVAVRRIAATYPVQAKVLQTVDIATLLALKANPADAAAGAKAVGELVAALHVTPAVATADLQSLTRMPQADALTLATSGPAVAAAAAQLTALAAVPSATLVTVATNGTQVQAAGAQLTALAAVPSSDLALLTSVQAASKKSPAQWQHWWWVCLGGQILFLPFIWLLRGRWSPRKAREDAQAHDTALATEMVSLGLDPASV